MSVKVKETDNQRLYEIHLDEDDDTDEEFKTDPQLYNDLFEISANIQLKILNMLSDHIIRILRQQHQQSGPKS